MPHAHPDTPPTDTQRNAAVAMSVIGGYAVALAVGSTDATECYKWSTGELTPTRKQSEKLEVVTELIGRLDSEELDDEGYTARIWFTGAAVSVGFGVLTPIEAVRNGYYKEVRAALAHFINCDFTT